MVGYDVQRKSVNQKSNSNSSNSITYAKSHNIAETIQMAKANPKILTSNDINSLQKTMGNQAVYQLIKNFSVEQNKVVEKNDGKLKNDESLQMEMSSNIFQRVEIPKEEDVLQSKFEPFQMKSENRTGLPDDLKFGVENMSGLSMDDVKVHYNSDKPAQVDALAYTQGTNIHVAPGQEKHLPHETWHVVQQLQGRVQTTTQMKGVKVNDDAVLEREADEMGIKVLQQKTIYSNSNLKSPIEPSPISLKGKPHNLSHYIQLKTVKQASLDGALAEDSESVLIKSTDCNTKGIVYSTTPIVKTNKAEVLKEAGLSYATFTNSDTCLKVTNLFSGANLAAKLLQNSTLKLKINDILSNVSPDLDAEKAVVDDKKAVVDEFFKKHLNSTIKQNISDEEVNSILDKYVKITKDSDKYKIKFNPMAPLIEYFKNKINTDWHNNAEVIPIEPFLYRFKGTINETDFWVTFQHCIDNSGYVVTIKSADNAATMNTGKFNDHPDELGVPDRFSAVHDLEPDTILANDLDLKVEQQRKQNAIRFDSMAKLAGEGARFICVRNNIGILKNTSKFYVKNKPDDNNIKYVTFEDLWSSWASVFDKGNNIPNSQVISKINISGKWYIDHKKDQSARSGKISNEVTNDVDLTK